MQEVSSKTLPIKLKQVPSGSTVTYRLSENSLRRRRHVPSYEFMAASVGDVEWLNQSLCSQRRENGTEESLVTYDSNGMSPIHLAAVNGHLNCVRLLIEQHAIAVDLPSKSGDRAIHLCIKCGDSRRAVGILMYLLAMGANPSVTTEDGVSPLHIAASQGDQQCLQTLLAAGAVVDTIDINGRTPYYLSRLYGHKECSRLISSAQWQQDKRNAAILERRREIDELQRLVSELNVEEELESERRRYCDKVFREWLQEHGLEHDFHIPDNATGKLSNRHFTCVSIDPSETTPNKVESGRVLGVASSLGDGVATARMLAGQNSNKPDIRWNPSTKPPRKPYVPKLGDCYPRNEFTKLPTAPPKRRTPSHAMKIVMKQRHRREADFTNNDSQSTMPRPRRDELIAWVETARVLSIFSSSKSSVFKPNHILDVEQRRMFDPDMVRRSEVPLHLSENDISSRLFRSALLPSSRQLVPVTGVSSVSNT